MNSPEIYAAKIRGLVKFGIGPNEASHLLDQFKGDSLLAAGYHQARECTVQIEGDREAWNLKAARNFSQSYELLSDYMIAESARPAVEELTDEEKRQRLMELMKKSLTVSKIFFQSHLSDPAAATYLQQRGISNQAVKKFELGYAPEGYRGLVDHYTYASVRNAAIDAGLLGRSETSKRHYDLFRDRLMFPIRSLDGALVGYGGRILNKEKNPDAAKYLNTRETLLFNKSNLLYGLFQNLERIRTEKQAIVVEGYLDVTSLSTNSFDYACAPMGTALTPDQIDQLMGLGVRKIWVCFDGDKAGEAAADRNIETIMGCYHPALEIMLVRMPQGEDPDSLIKAGGAAAFQTCLDNSITLLDHVHQFCQKGLWRPSNPALEDKAQYLLNITPFLQNAGGFLLTKLLDQASSYTGMSTEMICENTEGVGSREVDNQVASWHQLVCLAARWMVHSPEPLNVAEKMKKITGQQCGLADLQSLAQDLIDGKKPSGTLFDFAVAHGRLSDTEFGQLRSDWTNWLRFAQLEESVEQLQSMPMDAAAKQTIRRMLG